MILKRYLLYYLAFLSLLRFALLELLAYYTHGEVANMGKIFVGVYDYLPTIEKQYGVNVAGVAYKARGELPTISNEKLPIRSYTLTSRT